MNKMPNKTKKPTKDQDNPNRTSDIKRIKRWLKKNDITLKDIGVEGTFKDLDNDIIYSILEDMAEDDARETYDKYLEEESFKHMLEDEGL